MNIQDILQGIVSSVLTSIDTGDCAIIIVNPKKQYSHIVTVSEELADQLSKELAEDSTSTSDVTTH